MINAKKTGKEKNGIDIFDISRKVEKKKSYGQNFTGDINDGQVTCNAVDPQSGKVSGIMHPLEGKELDRSVATWTYYPTNNDRVSDTPALTLVYDRTNDAIIYTDDQGYHSAQNISEIPAEIAGLVELIQEQTVPNNAFNDYDRLMS